MLRELCSRSSRLAHRENTAQRVDCPTSLLHDWNLQNYHILKKRWI